MSKKESVLKDSKYLLLYDPGKVDPKTRKRAYYRHIYPRSLGEKIENVIPKVKKILEGKATKAFADISTEPHGPIKILSNTNKQSFSPESIIGFRAKDSSKKPLDVMAGDLSEKFSALKFDLEKEAKMIRAVRQIYRKRFQLKCCSRARTIMEPKIQLARKWLEDSKNEYQITKTVWEAFAIIKTYCSEEKRNCTDAFAYKIIYNLCGVFGIKRPSSPETLQKRIDRILKKVSEVPKGKRVDIKSTGAGFVGPEGEYYPPAHIMKALRSNGNAGNEVSRFLCEKMSLRDYALRDIL